MSDLDLDAILTRAEQAYAAAKNDADDLGLSPLTDATRQHFNYDVPALIGAVKRLTAELEQDRRELGRLRSNVGVSGAVFGPYENERQTSTEPMPQAVRTLHDAGRVKSGDPDRVVRDTILGHLLHACEDTGMDLGAYDRRVIVWLSGGEVSTAQVVIGLISRAYAARSWMVARDGGRFCERCEAEVRRGEAYELLPGSGGLLQHVHCPDQGRTASRG
jgi:hypothetical protein